MSLLLLRRSGFSPKSLTGLVNWWDASDPALTEADGVAVASWPDRAGTNPLIQATGTKQPLMKRAAINDKPALRFDGVDDGFLSTSLITQAHPFTQIAVAKRTKAVDGAWQGIFGDPVQVSYQSSAVFGPRMNGAYFPNPGVNVAAVMIGVFAGGNVTPYLNGRKSIAAAGGAYAANTLSVGWIGGGHYLGGDIAELIIYNRALTDLERRQIEQYLANKYAIGLFPNISPFAGYDPAYTGGSALGTALAQLTDTESTRHLTQGTGASQPTTQQSTNAMMVARFDGNDDWVSGSVGSIAQSTIFLVTKTGALFGNDGFIDGAAGGRHALWYSSTQMAIHQGGGSPVSGYDASSKKFLVSAVFAGDASSAVYINGDHKVTGDAGSHSLSTFSLSRYEAGAANYVEQDIGEVLVFNRVLSAAERIDVERFLMWKHGLGIHPADVSAALWLKADSLGLADAAAVASWTDSSGNARHAAQGTGVAQPTFQTNEINGWPVVRFDGVDDALQTVDGLALPQPQTILAVVRHTTGAVTANTGIVSGENYRPLLNVQNGAPDAYAMYAGTTLVHTTALNASAHVLTAIYNGASSKIVQDGVVVAGNPGVESAASSRYTVGSAAGGGTENPTEFFNGDIAEVLGFPSALSDIDRRKYEQSLGRKYGIAVTS